MFRGLVLAALSSYDLARVAGNTCTTNPIINRITINVVCYLGDRTKMILCTSHSHLAISLDSC